MNKKLLLIASFSGALSYAAENSFPVSIFSSANGKPQEDRASRDWVHNKLFVGVYDGHCGSKTADLLSRELHEQFKQYAGFQPVEEALETAVCEVDCQARQNYDDGSTAVAAYIEDNFIHVINIGDSRLIMEYNGAVGFATQDHTFENPEERTRVMQKKAMPYRFVDATTKKMMQYNPWRVNGLVPLRTIGDKFAKGDDYREKIVKGIGLGMHDFVCQIYKEGVDEEMYTIAGDFTIKPQGDQITADPDYMRRFLTEENRWLILATDGLTDVFSNHEIVRYVVENSDKGVSRDEIAESLVKEAINRKSGDNITVMICDLLQLRKR